MNKHRDFSSSTQLVITTFDSPFPTSFFRALAKNSLGWWERCLPPTPGILNQCPIGAGNRFCRRFLDNSPLFTYPTAYGKALKCGFLVGGNFPIIQPLIIFGFRAQTPSSVTLMGSAGNLATATLIFAVGSRQKLIWGLVKRAKVKNLATY